MGWRISDKPALRFTRPGILNMAKRVEIKKEDDEDDVVNRSRFTCTCSETDNRLIGGDFQST